jgi:hypothetical protein
MSIDERMLYQSFSGGYRSLYTPITHVWISASAGQQQEIRHSREQHSRWARMDLSASWGYKARSPTSFVLSHRLSRTDLAAAGRWAGRHN